MIKLTQQQEFELPLGVPLVALELPLDLLVDPHFLCVHAGQAALVHGGPRRLVGGGVKGGEGSTRSGRNVRLTDALRSFFLLRDPAQAHSCGGGADGQSLIT